ncbi:nucleotidyltransferase family protein [Undibacterium sp. Ji67W]|uniref:nucleotidyltransferase family protein n=1 Tax=Undibacterium sp. Ji67W TaxID=3413042 RepID=UPI003BF370C9
MNEAIILAGGLGTRLKSVSGDTPKPLVRVAGKAFIFHLLDKLKIEGIQRVVLAVSYRAELFMEVVGETYREMDILYSVETEPLGTGGGLSQALELVTGSHALVINGDTYVDFNLGQVVADYQRIGTPILLGVVSVPDVGRYGQIEFSESGHLLAFAEKGGHGEGFINAGVYIVPRKLPDESAVKFSFETDYLHKKIASISTSKIDGYFIDIGIPSDYQIACEYFA